MAFRPAFFLRQGRILAIGLAAVVGGLYAGGTQAAPFAQGFAIQPEAAIIRVHDDYGYGGDHHRGRDRGYERGWGGGHRGWDYHRGRGYERHGWGNRRDGWGHHHHHGGGYRGRYPY